MLSMLRTSLGARKRELSSLCLAAAAAFALACGGDTTAPEPTPEPPAAEPQAEASDDPAESAPSQAEAEAAEAERQRVRAIEGGRTQFIVKRPRKPDPVLQEADEIPERFPKDVGPSDARIVGFYDLDPYHMTVVFEVPRGVEDVVNELDALYSGAGYDVTIAATENEKGLVGAKGEERSLLVTVTQEGEGSTVNVTVSETLLQSAGGQ